MTVLERIDVPGCGCDAPGHLARLISIDEALRRIARQAGPVPETETVPLYLAPGRILAEPVSARAMAPPFDNAAMDGYAVQTAALAGDGPWTLAVTGRLPAGAMAGAQVDGLTAARIFTGAPVPAGADAVVRQEDVARLGDAVTIARRPAPGLNIRREGSDMQAGATVVGAGHRLGPREIAAAAAAGADAVHVRRRVRVALLVTGNEVRQAGARRGGAQIWDINTPMLSAALTDPALDLVRVAQGGDDPDELRRLLAEMAREADLVATTGGISVGEEDHVKPTLGALGAKLHFSGVAIKPGKPVSFGRIGPALWLGLPGNPLSAYVTWQVFGTALLRVLTGQGRPRHGRRHVAAGRPVRRRPGRCELRPARIVGFDSQGREVVEFEDATHSGRVAGLAAADGLIFLPGEMETLPEGGLVEFLPFRNV